MCIYLDTDSNKPMTAVTTNWRYLNTPQKMSRIEKARIIGKRMKIKIQKMTEKVEHLSSQSSTPVDNDLHTTITDIMDTYGTQVAKLPANNFKRIFWEQQVHTYVHICTYIFTYVYIIKNY